MSKITFVVNTTGLTGGIRVIFEYANRLAARGHEVRIVHYLNVARDRLTGSDGAKAILKKVKYTVRPGIDWFELKVPVTRYLPGEKFPDADIVIATANETADWVARLPERCGSKFYFIQHLETWTRDPEAVLATWKLPLKKIVIAGWLQAHAEAMGERVVACVPNGVNTSEFYCERRESHQPPRILMMTHQLAWKGTADGLEALQRVRGQGLAFELSLFGTHPMREALPLGATFVHNPRGERLRRLYCDHDIFVSPSWTEGYQLPPMEAMACGCAVVATNVGGIPDYAIADTTAVVVEPKRPVELAQGIAWLLSDPPKMRAIAEAGLEHIRRFSWDASTDRFETALLNHA